jgi:homoserine O-acetyltransferase
MTTLSWKDQQRGRPAVEPGVALRCRPAAQARCGHAAVAVPDRLPDLWHAERRPSNAILVCHALTGDQHVANTNPVTGKPGWWEVMIGPGKPSTPTASSSSAPTSSAAASAPPARPRPTRPPASPMGSTCRWSPSATWCAAQQMLVDHFGIEQLFCVIGGSMGGMQVLQWASSYPERVFSALPIATGARHSSQNIAFHEVGRQAVMADPDWHGGKYFDRHASGKGLAVARMAAHITYLSERRCTGSSAASSRIAKRRPSASTPTSRSRAICATRA